MGVGVDIAVLSGDFNDCFLFLDDFFLCSVTGVGGC
jgi:hypothetical protein